MNWDLSAYVPREVEGAEDRRAVNLEREGSVSHWDSSCQLARGVSQIRGGCGVWGFGEGIG